MSELPWPSLLRCGACESEQLFQRDDMIERLGEHNMLRRNVEPEPELLAELWNASLVKFACSNCGVAAMTVIAPDDELDGWLEAKQCEDCDNAISAERLEIFPNSVRCASCQRKADQGEQPAEEIDYCPHCGSIREMRQSQRGGITGYRLYCPACRRG